MAIVVPATDVGNAALQTQIAAVQALVNANANPAVQPQLTILLDQLQQQLVQSLMANALDRAPGTGNAANKLSFITASGVISSGTINQ